MQNQTNLELKAISKRTKDSNLNDEKLFGVTDNQVKGHSINDEYDINGEDNKKGGDELGSITDHLHSFDFTTGGNKVDVKEREKQLEYAINGINKYLQHKAQCIVAEDKRQVWDNATSLSN